MEFYSYSDIGRCRRENQDCCGHTGEKHAFLAVVCDGMGGAAAGDLAARTVMESLTADVRATLNKRGKERPPMVGAEIKRMLWSAVDSANKRVYELAKGDDALHGMGTTLAAVFFYFGQAYTVHVGDSRVYLFREGQMRRLTHDHSLVQNLIDAGTLTEEEARVHPSRNVITRAVGVSDDVSAEYASLPLQSGDLFLLCTDGLTGMVSDARITELLSAEKSVAVKAEALINEALAEGGEDNVTAFLVECGEDDVYSVWEALTEVKTEDITATFGMEASKDEEVRTGREEFE